MKKIDYNKQEILNCVNNLKIHRDNDSIITMYFNRKIASAKVSKRYEVFQFADYINQILPLIEKNFIIKSYQLLIKGGKQSLRLYSDDIKLNISGKEEVFTKTFNIVSSSDKSRALQFNLGFYVKSSDIHFVVNLKDAQTYKKHFIGITNHVNLFTDSIDNNSFDEQLDLIKSLSGHKVSLKDIKSLFIEEKENKSLWNKFLVFKKILLSSFSWNEQQLTYLYNTNPNFEYNNDIQLDAYSCFVLYMSLFKREDSYVVSKETKRILGIRNVIKRQNKLKAILA